MAPKTFRVFCLLLTITITSAPATAQTIRVATCDLGATPEQGKTPIEDAAEKLKPFSPEVVLVRRAAGWKACAQLAEMLKPAEYKVVACSAFRDPSNNSLLTNQIGVIARHPAYFFWTEPWDNPGPSYSGGFAFAALQIAGHRFGFSCVDIDPTRPAAAEPLVSQWLKALDAYRGWANNRLEGFVSATFGVNLENKEVAPLIRAAGLVPLPAGKDSAYDLAHLLPSADSPAGLVLTKWPMICEFDFHPPPVVVSAAPVSPTAPTEPSFFRKPAVAWWFAGGVAFFLVTILILQLGLRRRLSRLQQQGALLSLNSGSYNLVLPPPALPIPGENTAIRPPEPIGSQRLRHGIIAHLTEWMKQTFVQRLMRDRQKLAATQQEATMKLLDVDDRLARLEIKIQKETATYEKQIEQLSRELLTSREENLELIRAQISLLKSEMENARNRVLESEEP